MRLITYDIDLLEPVLVTALDGDPNSSIAYNFIPGSALRGAMIGRYRKRHGAIEIDSVRDLFFSDETQFLNGYCTIHDNNSLEDVRSWPLPLSLRREKPKADEETPYRSYDFVWDASAENVQRVSAQFGIIDGASGQTAEIKRQISIHTSRDREAGRSTRDSGDIYNYEALAPHQTFRAHILTTLDAVQIQPLLDLLEGELHLGGTRSAGYGRVRLRQTATQETLAVWQAARWRATNKDQTIITLLSDVLLRDECGNWTTDPRQLAHVLGLELVGEQAYPAIRPIGGFNRKWGLPLPQSTAFKMGTVLICQPPADEAGLKDRVLRGVGEGRLDGFGRIAVNWHTQSQLTIFATQKQSPGAVMLSEEQSRKLAQLLVLRMWRTRLDAAIVVKANELVSRPQHAIRKSQLYRLRMVVQDAIRSVQAGQPVAEVRRKLIKYLEDVQERKTPRKQFDKARIDGKRSLEWLTALIEQNNLAIDVDPVQLGDVIAQADDALVLEYNLRLIDVVLAQIAKHNRKEERHEQRAMAG